MTNDQLRGYISESGVTADNVTLKQLMELHDKLSEKLENSKCFHGTFEMNPLELNENSKFMTCKSDYFDSREAVSFNRDGFIGMAGWADNKNIAPIREAVIEWASEIRAKGE